MTDDADVRRRTLIASLAARLECVRGDMTDADFSRLLENTARTVERSAEIDAGYTRPSRWQRASRRNE
jgi:hypothetical protein